MRSHVITERTPHQEKMAIKTISLIIILFSILTACRGYTPPQYSPELYPRTYRFYDLSFFWKTEQEGDTYTITGFAKNTRYSYIRDLELTVILLDDQRKSLAKETFFFIPTQMPMDELSPFTLRLTVKAGAKPAKIKFSYLYHLVEREYDKTPYFYSFETDLP